MRFDYNSFRRLGVFILIFLISSMGFAQRKIVFEDLRVQTFNSPLLNYVKDASMQSKMLDLFNQVLTEFHYGSIRDQQGIPTIFISENGAIKRTAYQHSVADSLDWHMHVDLLEAIPETYFAQPENQELDSMISKRAKAVFILDISFLDANKRLVKRESLQILLTPSSNMGFGYLYNNGIGFGNLAITPKAFLELIKASTQILFNPKNELAVVEIGVAPAYFLSNCFTNASAGKVKLNLIQQDEIWKYHWHAQQELFKSGEPLYHDLLWKGNQIQQYPEPFQLALKSAAKDAKAQFVFLVQSGRDIINDKNYQLQMVSQVVPVETSISVSKKLVFLPTNHHYLFQEKDTLARFSIHSQVLGTCTVDLNKIHNGIDTLSYQIPNVEQGKSLLQIKYTHQLIGDYAGKNFQIQMTGNKGYDKAFYLDNQLVFVSRGKAYPEELLLFDASLTAEYINGLLFIGFNPFLE